MTSLKSIFRILEVCLHNVKVYEQAEKYRDFLLKGNFSNGYISVNIQHTDVILHPFDVILEALSHYGAKLPKF